MGLPSINIKFQTLGISAIQRSQKGIVAVILRDSAAKGAHTLEGVADIPQELSEENKGYLEQAFLGYLNPPRRVLCYVMTDEQTIENALEHFAAQQFDYLCGPPTLEPEDAQKIVSWIKSERQNDHMVKAVLPETAADSEAIVNFSASGIQAGEKTYTAAQYCARIAGLLAGTPMDISCTFAPLPELTGVKRLSRSDLDTAIRQGKFILFFDGEKIKTGRAINSLTTLAQGKGEAFQKIKIVEAMDMMKTDIRKTAEDSYIGKYANAYDNKCLLIMAIKGYLEQLEQSGILQKDHSLVELDLAAQKTYLKSQGIETSQMTEQQLKEANTGSKVFLQASVGILDAIEDIDLVVTI